MTFESARFRSLHKRSQCLPQIHIAATRLTTFVCLSVDPKPPPIAVSAKFLSCAVNPPRKIRR